MNTNNSLIIIFVSLFLFSVSLFAKLPPTPAGFKVSAFYTNAVMLKWESTENKSDGFILERSQDGINYEPVKYFNGDCNSYLDIGLIKDRNYNYRLCAVNIEGKSEFTKEISAFTSPTEYCTIGSDTIQTPYPFYLTYTSSRTQMLYKRSEFTATGCNSMSFFGLQFYLKSSPVGNLSQMTIRMKNTTDTAVSGFSDSGWTTVYSSYIYFNQNGWTNANFSTWYTVNQNNNLLIEFCFNAGIYYSSNAFVRSSYAPGKTWHAHADYLNGCTLTGGTTQSYRPNMHFINFINTVIKIRDVENPEYHLEQNYPNPFNGSTKFRFSIKKQSPVSLTLYDILGRQEVIVFNEPLGPGVYEKVFYPDNFSLSSGIYYYCLSTPDYSEVKKLVILK